MYCGCPGWQVESVIWLPSGDPQPIVKIMCVCLLILYVFYPIQLYMLHRLKYFWFLTAIFVDLAYIFANPTQLYLFDIVEFQFAV